MILNRRFRARYQLRRFPGLHRLPIGLTTEEGNAAAPAGGVGTPPWYQA